MRRPASSRPSARRRATRLLSSSTILRKTRWPRGRESCLLTRAGARSLCVRLVGRSQPQRRDPKSKPAHQPAAKIPRQPATKRLWPNPTLQPKMSRSRQSGTLSRPSNKEQSNAPPSGPPATAGLLRLGAGSCPRKLLISRAALPSTLKRCAGIISRTGGAQAVTGSSVTFATRQDDPCSCA